MIQPNTVITGDSLNVLREMDAESVDMVITDPPYGIDYQSNRPRSKNPGNRFAKIANEGIELDPKYSQIAADRAAEYLKGDTTNE